MRFKRVSAILCTPVASASPAAGQVSYDDATRVFRIAGGDSDYDLHRQKRQPPLAALGAELGPTPPMPVRPGCDWAGPDTPDQNPALDYAGQGAGYVPEPQLKAAWPDGNRDVVLRCRAHCVAGDTLEIDLADVSCPPTVTLTYSVDRVTGIVARSAKVRSTGKGLVRRDQFVGSFALPYQPDYYERVAIVLDAD